MASLKEIRQRIEFVATFYTGTLLPEINPYIQHWNEITDGLFLGGLPIATSFLGMGNHGEKIRAQCDAKGMPLGAVYSVVNPFEINGEGLGLKPVSPKYWTEKNVGHKLIPCDDFGGNLDIDEVKKTVDEMDATIKSGKSVYVHCKAGKGRSFALVACYLLANTTLDVTQILALLRQKRSQVSPSEAQYELIEKFRAKYCPTKAPLNRDSIHFQSYRKDWLQHLKSPFLQAIIVGLMFGVLTSAWLVAPSIAVAAVILSQGLRYVLQRFDNKAYNTLKNPSTIPELTIEELKAARSGMECTTWKGWATHLNDLNATWHYTKYRGGLRLAQEKDKQCDKITALITEKTKVKL